MPNAINLQATASAADPFNFDTTVCENAKSENIEPETWDQPMQKLVAPRETVCTILAGWLSRWLAGLLARYGFGNLLLHLSWLAVWRPTRNLLLDSRAGRLVGWFSIGVLGGVSKPGNLNGSCVRDPFAGALDFELWSGGVPARALWVGLVFDFDAK